MRRGRPPRLIPAYRPKPTRPYVDPNRRGSPRYTERHRRKVTEPIPGITRVDIGSEAN